MPDGTGARVEGAVRDETARALLRVDGREAAGAAREEVGRGRGARVPTRRRLVSVARRDGRFPSREEESFLGWCKMIVATYRCRRRRFYMTSRSIYPTAGNP